MNGYLTKPIRTKELDALLANEVAAIEQVLTPWDRGIPVRIVRLPLGFGATSGRVVLANHSLELGCDHVRVSGAPRIR